MNFREIRVPAWPIFRYAFSENHRIMAYKIWLTIVNLTLIRLRAS